MRDPTTPLLQTSKGKGGREYGSSRKRTIPALAAVLTLAVGVVLLAGGGGNLAGNLTGSRATTAAEGSSDSGGGGGHNASAAAAGSSRWSWIVPDGSGSASKAAADLQNSESLEEAHKRARKAAALPLPEFRSSAEGISLSAGAAEAAAACQGDGCELVSRFVFAVGVVRELVEAGGCVVQHCPDALGIGLRPVPYTAHAFGNRCEPLYTRGAVELVRQLLAPDMVGLEWFTGSSTSWFLQRLAHLTSIETAPGFAAKARSVAEAQYEAAALKEKWDLRVVPPQRDVLTFEDSESALLFGDYCRVGFVPEGKRFDIISVQGFARMACLRRAVTLLKPQGGMLVLPQAQRPAYRDAVQQIVPPHWLRFSDTHLLGHTLVWMSVNKA